MTYTHNVDNIELSEYSDCCLKVLVDGTEPDKGANVEIWFNCDSYEIEHIEIDTCGLRGRYVDIMSYVIKEFNEDVIKQTVRDWKQQERPSMFETFANISKQ